MARSGRRTQARKGATGYTNATAADIARYGVRGGRPEAEGQVQATAAESAAEASGAAVIGGSGAAVSSGIGGYLGRITHTLSLSTTDHLADQERQALRRRVLVCVVVLVVLSFLSLCIYGANGGWGLRYEVFTPLDVIDVVGEHLYNTIGGLTGVWSPHDTTMYYRDWPLYYAIGDRAGVIVITLICAVLLSISGMLYQNVFRNPIAGPGMLGVSSGVSLGMMLLVYLYGGEAIALVAQRYGYCYGLGAAILVLVIAAGRRLSGRGKPFDIVSTLLIGVILSQLVGFVVSYVTLFVMDPDMYQIYLTLSEMLVVDTSPISWICLGIATVVSVVPVWRLRFRLNALSFDEQEVKLLGINLTALRGVALVCGGIMILAAQIHIGMVAMVSLIVPFLARSWFGCESRKQLIGSACIGAILLLVCRDVVDLVPFVGDGIGIGSAVSVAALPLFLLIMARHMRGWE